MNKFEHDTKAKLLVDSHSPYYLASKLLEEQEKRQALEDRLESIVSPEKAKR